MTNKNTDNLLFYKLSEEDQDDFTTRYHLLLDSGRMFINHPEAQGFLDDDKLNNGFISELLKIFNMSDKVS